MRTSRMSRAAWPMCWVTLLLAATGLWLALHNGAAVRDVSHVPFVLACAVAGALLGRHRPANPIGWLLLANAASFALLDACGQAATYGAVTRPGAVPGATALAWPQTWLWVPANASLTVVAVFFPDGRLLSARWRLPLAAYAALAAVTALAGALRPGPNAQVGPAGMPNPLGVDGWLPVASLTEAGFGVACLLLFVTAAGTVVRRAHAERGVRRQQLKWLGYALALSIVVVLGRLVAGLTDGHPEAVWPAQSTAWDVAGGLATTAIPVALGIAILRHRLFDIDLIISRSVVYLILSVLVAGAYLAIVGLLGVSASIAAAAAAALLLTPLRDRLQRRVNQLVYGDRDDPYAVLSRLGAQLEQVQDPGAVLAAGAATVKDALQLSYVGVHIGADPGSHELDGDEGHTYELGTRPDRPVDLPLVAAGEPVGRLRLGPRPGEAALSGQDLRLLGDLARQLAVAAQALRVAARAQRLSEDLQRSREQLVVAREEERRRLRRDLHDGLGPTLAGLTMRAEAALELGGDPRAAQLLEEIVADTQTAIADVRRLVDGLRPPALDTLGLAGALRAHVTGWPAGSGPRVTFHAPDPLPPLSAATEVAAYRIAVEALANARRHAGARYVEVRLAVAHHTGAGQRLRVTVADDGTGLSAAPGAGVGLHSLRERAAELGGLCQVTTGPDGGTLVAASLPLTGAADRATAGTNGDH